MTKIFRNIFITLTLVSALLLTSCRGPQTVMTIADVVITPGIYLTAQLNAYSTVSQEFYGSQDLLEEVYEDGNTAEDEINTLTRENLNMYVYALKNFDEAGHTLTEEQLSSFDLYHEYEFASSETYLADNGIGQQSYYDYNLALYKIGVMFENEYLGEGESAPTQQELADYIDENYKRVEFVDVPTVTPEYSTLEEEALTTQKDLAEEMADAIRDDGDITTVAGEFLPQAYEAVGNTTFDAENVSAYVQNQLVSEENTSLNSELATLIMGQSVGTVSTFEDWDAVVVYKVLDNYSELSEVEQERDTMTYEIFYDTFIEEVEAAGAEFTADIDSGAVNFYSLKKVVA